MDNIVIGGLQKTTMIDFSGKIASTVFTKGCNFRCPYCHNRVLVLEEDSVNHISEDEILRFLKKRVGILDGVCISGGEPLIHKNINNFIKKIKEMGYLVKLDTNGSFPQKLRELIKNNLVDYIAMDIKNSPENYSKAIGVNYFSIEDINESIKLLKTNQVAFEFRTTVVKGIHEIQDFVSIARWIKGTQPYYLQNYKDSGDTIASKFRANKYLESFTKKELEIILDEVKEKVPNTQIRYT